MKRVSNKSRQRKLDLYEYYKNKRRDWMEAYLDCHNRKAELVRTICAVIACAANIITLLVVTGKVHF